MDWYAMDVGGLRWRSCGRVNYRCRHSKDRLGFCLFASLPVVNAGDLGNFLDDHLSMSTVNFVLGKVDLSN